MMDLLLQMGLSNACFALILALVAVAVGFQARRPHLAHLLWLLVFVKLVTPPLVTIPIGVFPQQPDHTDADAGAFSAGQQSAVAETTPGFAPLSSIAPMWNRAKSCLATLWLLGSAIVLVWSMARVCRFGRLLAAESEVAPQELQEEADKMARQLGLATAPTIRTIAACLSPMVWWTGGQVRIVIPRALLDQMDVQNWRWILAHEMAHVRRRDYLVRWIEWLACVCFWWNPVVWWAQRNLRAAEEICCDDLVISTLHPKPKSYADSLLSAVEFLARPAVRAPAMASEINSGGSLERRFRMIVSGKSNQADSRWLRMCVLACALAVLPLGMASAQNYDAVGKRLQKSVKRGEITQPQADAMMTVLKKETGKKDQDTDKATAHLMKLKKALGAAVEAGRISKEDAVKKYEAAQKGLKEETTAKSQGRTDLQAKVQAGELTKEQALAKMSALKAEATKKNQESDQATAYLTKVKKDLAAAVEAGKISKEDAVKKYETAKKDLQKKMAAKGQGHIDLDAAWKKLQAKVRAGELTKEQAQAQMAALKKENARKDQGSDKAATSPTKVKKDLGAAIEAGKIGKENAPTKDIKKKPAAQPDYDAIGRDLKAAVQAGKLTKEEAKAKWEAIKKGAAGDKGEN
jgi:beta-lactamase regulating signal transducer with metallopeptidase domain